MFTLAARLSKCRFPNDERAICQYISSSTHFGILLNILRIVEWRIRLFSVGILDWVYIWISSEENAKIRFLISEFFFLLDYGGFKAGRNAVMWRKNVFNESIYIDIYKTFSFIIISQNKRKNSKAICYDDVQLSNAMSPILT